MRTITLTYSEPSRLKGCGVEVAVRNILWIMRDRAKPGEAGDGCHVHLHGKAERNPRTGSSALAVRESFEAVADVLGGSEVMPDHNGDIAVYIVREHDEDDEHIDDIGHYLDRDEARQVFVDHDGPCSLRVAYFRYHGSEEQERKGPDPAKEAGQ